MSVHPPCRNFLIRRTISGVNFVIGFLSPDKDVCVPCILECSELSLTVPHIKLLNRLFSTLRSGKWQACIPSGQGPTKAKDKSVNSKMEIPSTSTKDHVQMPSIFLS